MMDCFFPCRCCLAWLLVATTGAVFAWQPPTAADSPPTELPRIAPLSPQAALEAFQVAPGYRIELVAAEPLVVDPVAFCFDAAGRLIVVEMRGYSERPDDHAGRVRRLSDADGDGQFDHSEIIIEGLAWPTAVACIDGGILVAAAPDLIFVPEESTGQLAPPADAPLAVDFSSRTGPPQVWARGFGTSNVQGLLNSLRWGLDCRLHGATSSSGGQLIGLGHAAPIRLGRRDFAIDPLRQQFELVDGGGQHGMMIDPWGDKFVCSNSDHLQQVMLLPHRDQRGERTSVSPPLRRSIASDGPQADVYRASPVEPWRILRTHLRVSGQATGPIEGGGRAAGYFTGATGVYVYDGDQWPTSKSPIALISDVGSNLIHRKRLNQDGLWKNGQRIDEMTEFIRSTDIWFRPVQLGTGPDGALYIADMYREVIEHPLSLPPLIKSQLDLNSGNDRGRIWRVIAEKQSDANQPSNTEQQASQQQPKDLATLDLAGLIEQIDHANAWHRRTAARLLLESSRRSQVSEGPALAQLRQLARAGQYPAGRSQALAVLQRLDESAPTEQLFDVSTALAALRDPHHRVRQRTIEWIASTPQLSKQIPADQWLALAKDESIFVRFQMAYEAAALVPDSDSRAEVLAAIAAQSPGDAWVQWAVEGSLGSAASKFLSALATDENAWQQNRQQWLNLSCFQIVHADPENHVADLVALLQATSDLESGEDRMPLSREALLQALVPAVSRQPANGPLAPLASWIAEALIAELLDQVAAARGQTLSTPAATSLASRMQLVRWATSTTLQKESANSLLDQWLQSSYGPQIQILALQNLAADTPEQISLIIDRLPQLTPTVQAAALGRLAENKMGLTALAAAITDSQVAPQSIPADVEERLWKFLQFKLSASTSAGPKSSAAGDLAATFDVYREGLAGEIDREVGRKVFQRVCSACHRVGEVGNQVGPELKSLVDKSAEQILISIIDPNREVDPRYRMVQIETIDGRLLAGILEQETESDLTLVDNQGKPHRVARDEIEQLQTRNQSLMPTGLEREITIDQMRHLIGLLKDPS